MKIVLITGITGKIGANMALALLKRGYCVRGLLMPEDPLAYKLDGLEVDRFEADLRDLDGVMRAAKGVDAVIHLAAAIQKYPGMTDRDYFEVNVTGTWDMVYAAREAAPNLERFVYISTEGTYSRYQAQYLPVDEAHPQRPFSPYGMVKILGEQTINHFYRQYDMPTTIARIGSVQLGTQMLNGHTAREAIGILKWAAQHPRSNLYVDGVSAPWKVIEEAVTDLDTLVIPRDPQGESWLYHPTDMRDTVEGVILALEKEAAIGETFNIFAAEATSWEAAARYIQAKQGRPLVEVSVPNTWVFCCDISKARRVLGYNPQYDFRRMIDDAIAFANGRDIGVIAG